MPGLTCLVDGSTVNPFAPGTEDVPEWPSDFFAQGGQVRLRVDTKKTTDVTRPHILAGLSARRLTAPVVNAFLYTVLVAMTATLEATWKSFNVTFGNRGDNLNPFSLLVVEHVPIDLSDKAAGSDFKVDDFSLAMFLLGLYRVGRAKIESYRTLLFDGLIAQCKVAYPDFKVNVLPTNDFFNIWANDPNYSKIVAVTDMFFHYFKKHPSATLRFGTIASRFKDCAAIATIGHLMTVTGMTVREVAKWILNQTVAREFKDIMKEGQEAHDPDSYTPYMIDLGISKKSPYSAVQNPHTHFWGQMTCFFLYSARARNARVIQGIEVSSLLASSLLFAFAVGRTPELRVWYIEDDEKDVPRPHVFDDGVPDIPKTRNSRKWVAWYIAQGNKFTDEMIKFAKEAVAHAPSVRDETVGQFARQHFLGENAHKVLEPTPLGD